MAYVHSLFGSRSPLSVEYADFLPDITPGTQASALRKDHALIAELAALHDANLPVTCPETGLSFQNDELLRFARSSYTTEQIETLEAHLKNTGTLTIPILKKGSVIIDGRAQELSLVAATEVGDDGASHGDMSSMIYLRDQIQTAAAYMNLAQLDPGKYTEEATTGHDILMSALHLMSTEAQLARLQNTINLGPEATQADWPHISIHFRDLESKMPNGWRNTQDTIQMLAYTTIEALETGFIGIQDLAEDHKTFLRGIPQLLKSVGFPYYENSGSWEEITAVRSSVMSIETALLYKMKQLYDTDRRFSFLEYDDSEDLSVMLGDMIKAGLHALGSRLPNESPEYSPDSVKHRSADAALIYVLRYGIPELLAKTQTLMKANGNQPMSVTDIEDLVLQEVFTLIDSKTNGMRRYENDSYQRVDFHTNSVQLVIEAIKKKVAQDAQEDGNINLDQKQELRDKLTPAGPCAAWTHPLGQIAGWAAKRSRESSNAEEAHRYRSLADHFLTMALSTITSRTQYNAAFDKNGTYHVKQVPAYKLPECYISYQRRNDAFFHLPSPHTPLNWSTAMLKESLGELSVTLQTNSISILP